MKPGDLVLYESREAVIIRPEWPLPAGWFAVSDPDPLVDYAIAKRCNLQPINPVQLVLL